MRDQLRIISNNESTVPTQFQLGSPSHTPTPPCDPCLNRVSASCNHADTGITPTHTPITPPTHTHLSQKQAFVFEYLEKNVSRRTSYNTIGAALGLSKSAARDAILGLVSKKYILNITTIRDGVFQGFEYRIDGAKCEQFFEAGGTANPKYLTSNYFTPPPHTVCPPVTPSHTHSSSYNSDLKLTTKTVDLEEPELLWWTDQGLTSKQIISWLDQFRMKPEELAQSLRFARFDVVVNQIMSNGKPIENPQNWFYSILKRAGSYTRPKNYKSIYEIRANEIEEQQRHDDSAKVKIWEAEIETKLNELLSNQESPLYLELLSRVDDFAKDNQFVREIQMKELLKETYPMVQSWSKG